MVTIETDDGGRVISQRPSRGRRLDANGRWVDVPDAELEDLWRRYA